MIVISAVHPFKKLRYSIDLSINKMADLCGVGRSVILKTEAGLYAKPPVETVNLLAICTPYSRVDIEAAYDQWVLHHRQQSSAAIVDTAYYYGVTEWSTIKTDGTMSPFEQFMTRAFGTVSQMARCRAICVHPATLARYESGETYALPEQIRQAFMVCGISVFTVASLDLLGQVYYNERA